MGVTLETLTQSPGARHQKLTIKMGKTGAEGGGAQQMMYGFIFVMYAITAGVLFYVMFNRRERKRKRAEASERMSSKDPQEVTDDEVLKEQQKEIEGEQAGAEVSGGEDEDKADEDVKKTSFEEPTVEEIKQLQEQPKKLMDKKTE